MACVSLYIIIHIWGHVPTCTYMYLSPNKTVLYMKYNCTSSCIINMACVSLYIIIHMRSCTYMYIHVGVLPFTKQNCSIYKVYLYKFMYNKHGLCISLYIIHMRSCTYIHRCVAFQNCFLYFLYTNNNKYWLHPITVIHTLLVHTMYTHTCTCTCTYTCTCTCILYRYTCTCMSIKFHHIVIA